MPLTADASLREVSGTVNDTRLGQRLVLIEARQATLERAQKQLELQIGSLGEELAHRPLKTDVISAIAQQELLVEACAPREAFEKLEATVEACAAASTVAALGETVRTLSTQLTTAATSLGDLKESAASKATLQQRGKEIESLRTRLDEKLSRDECVSLLASKLEKSEARSIVQQQEQMQASVIATEAMAKRLQESLSSTSNHAHDATGTVREISSRIDRLSSLTQELDGRMTARRNELTSLTKVRSHHALVRLLAVASDAVPLTCRWSASSLMTRKCAAPSMRLRERQRQRYAADDVAAHAQTSAQLGTRDRTNPQPFLACALRRRRMSCRGYVALELGMAAPQCR